MNILKNVSRTISLVLAGLLFALLISGLTAAQPTMAQSSALSGPIRFGGDPCRDAQGNEICTHFWRPDGRINNNDPLETITGYCQADHSLQIWGVYSGVGQYLASTSASDMVDGIQAAIQSNNAQIIVDVKGMQLIGLPSGQLELADNQTGSGYTFTFSPTVCGLPVITGNPASVTTATALPASGTLSADSSADIPLISPSATQIQNTIRISLRNGPGYTYTRLTYLPRGSVLTLIAKIPMQNQVQWIKVTYGSYTGWVVAYYTNISLRVLRNLPLDTAFSSDLQPTATLPSVG